MSKSSQSVDTGPKLDLGFKEGQTITLNIGVKQYFLQFVTDNKWSPVEMSELFC